MAIKVPTATANITQPSRIWLMSKHELINREPARPAGPRQRRLQSPTIKAAAINTPRAPHELTVEKTRNDSACGKPVEENIPDCIIHCMSHGGASRNWYHPYAATTTATAER